MTVIRDEQILAAFITLTGYSRFSDSFLNSIYYSIAKLLVEYKIVWLRPYKDFEDFANKFSSYWKWNHSYLEATREKVVDYYSAFLESLPEEQQKVIATVLKTTGYLK
jgi:hypothetical protein